jgi:hypothetical protein
MIGFFMLAYADANKPDNTLSILWFCSGLLINPFIKVALGRELWNLLDVLWAILLTTTLIADVRKHKA